MFLTVERGVVSTLDPYGATSSPCSAGTFPHRGRQRYAQGRVFCAYVGSDTYPLRGILIRRVPRHLPLLGEGNRYAQPSHFCKRSERGLATEILVSDVRSEREEEGAYLHT